MKYLQHPEDCKRIQEACLKYNWDISLSEADVMWGWHSMGLSCGWSSLPTTQQSIWDIIEPLLDRLMAGEDFEPEIGQDIHPQIQVKQTTRKEKNMNLFEYKIKCNRCLTVEEGLLPMDDNEQFFHDLLTDKPITTFCMKCKAETEHKVIYLARDGEELTPQAPLPDEPADHRFQLTIDILNNPANRSKMLAEGTIPNSPEGIYMTNSNTGALLRWVLKAGGGYGDWAVYCHWSSQSAEWVMENGDKVTTKDFLLNIIDFDDECWKKYRF